MPFPHGPNKGLGGGVVALLRRFQIHLQFRPRSKAEGLNAGQPAIRTNLARRKNHFQSAAG
jgi:hypothetical protein